MKVHLTQAGAIYFPNPAAWPARDVSVSIKRRVGESDGDVLSALADAVKDWEADQSPQPKDGESHV